MGSFTGWERVGRKALQDCRPQFTIEAVSVKACLLASFANKRSSGTHKQLLGKKKVKESVHTASHHFIQAEK